MYVRYSVRYDSHFLKNSPTIKIKGLSMKAWMYFGICAGALSLFNSISVNAQEGKINIENCHLDGIKQQVQCGTLIVPENYDKPAGETVSINFAVLPAIDNSENKTPLMFLAGGPGQAAVELASGLRRVFNEVRKTRDLILVDQRGTGKSSPLQCESDYEQNIYSLIPEEMSNDEITECIESFDVDLAQFNSENAIRDFDAVREALGHKKINIYGGSYGTRAGLVYMRLFPDSLRSVVLDSVGPIEVPIGLFGQSISRSFDLLIEHCNEEVACQSAFPDLGNEFQVLVNRLEKAPVSVDIAHPRLGTQTKFRISKGKLLGAIRLQLYGVSGRSLAPLVIHQAYLGNFMPLAGLIAQTEGDMGMYTGLTLNILCNEDFPRISEEQFIQDADNPFGKGESHQALKEACAKWPKYRPDEAFYQSVTADIPTLILSGELDPVTPPSNGDKTAATLPNNHHIVVKNSSHTVAMSTCASDIVNEFLTSLKPKELDESCLEDIPAESFLTNLNGGDANVINALEEKTALESNEVKGETEND
jgi:pimeloyl-ACP methyl ester carboxylesterase